MNKSAFVKVSLTPEGVEHRWASSCPFLMTFVKVSLTPEGVEHVEKLFQFIRQGVSESFVPFLIVRLADVGIRRTWRDVGPCRVRLAGLTDRANFQPFSTDANRTTSSTFDAEC